MKTVNLGFKLTLSPLLEEIVRFQIGIKDIKANLQDYKTDSPTVYEGEIPNLLIVNGGLDVWYTINGIPGQECSLSITINGKPLPFGPITTPAGNNHRAVCDNNNSKGYALPL